MTTEQVVKQATSITDAEFAFYMEKKAEGITRNGWVLEAAFKESQTKKEVN